MKNTSNSKYNTKYKSWSNFIYIIKQWLKWDLKGSIMMFLSIPGAVALPILTAIMTKIFVNGVEKNQEMMITFWQIFGISIIIAILTWFCKYIEVKQESFQLNISFHYAVELMEKLMDMDYSHLEDYYCRKKFERCKNFAFQGAMSDGAWVSIRLINLLKGFFGSFSFLFLISSVHPILLLVILITTGVELFISRGLIKIGTITEDDMSDTEMKFHYFYRIANNPSFGKDIRIYRAKEWLLTYLEKAQKSFLKAIRSYTISAIKGSGEQAICWLIRDGLTYYFIINAVLNRSITAGDFLFYMTLVLGFSHWLNEVAGDISAIQRVCVECDRFRAFLEYPDEENGGQHLDFKNIDTIEFKDISFAYTGGKEVLKNINFTINSNEKIALVGENGAGKTTLIKLLCGLYKPTGGVILINGQDITKFNTKEYFKLFSVLFQDFMILPASIRANVIISECVKVEQQNNEVDEEVWEALELAGIKEKVKELPLQLDEKLIKSIDKEAVDFSGGEIQRLLLARAIYRKAPILILDEPSSALDPLAEEQLYLKYNQVTKERISIFISHRLTSTQFCDKIFLLEKGEIIEKGTHEELMSNGTQYRTLFELQGKYYQPIEAGGDGDE